MEMDQEESEAIFKRISKLSESYTPPTNACNTFKAFYAILGEFEQELHRHIHLKNNILIPKAQKLKQEFENC